MSTHISSGADEVLASAAESGPEDPLDALLKQIVGGYFVLTDGQGSVSKWSEPAELLFGRPAQEILGQSFFGTLLDQALSAEAQAWRSFLETGEAPTVAGRVSVSGLHAEGRQFPIEAVFVPVKLDEGFDFSLFLEDLGFELPLNLMLLRMRQQHPVVVRALRQAIEAEPQPWEGWRTAGTLVVFRPTEPTPWVEEQLAARDAARAEQDAEVEERLSTIDPGVHGSSVRDLDDAAAVVARLLSAMERIDDLERMASGLPAQLQEARRDVDASRTRAEAAEREASRLRGDLERALTEIKAGGNDSQHLELLARMDRLERARLDEDAARASALKAVEASRHELAMTLEGIERDRERDAEAARAELRAALERVEHVQRESDALREQLTKVTVERHEAEGLAGEERRRLADLQREAEETRARIDGLREAADALREESRAEVAELRAALATDETEELRAAQQELQAKLEEQLAELRKGSGTDLEELRVAAEELRTAQRGIQAQVAEQLAALQADAGTDVGEVRTALEALRT